MSNVIEQQVFQREGDPMIYLQVMGQWFYYDRTFFGIPCSKSDQCSYDRFWNWD